ncbi:MAG TPA: hypothetical protein VFS20_33850 [Longimicrobium sp.]|nr:hypothetical protein [Longimicrobium sp.]
MQYPLSLTFKIMAFAPQIWMRDAAGQLQMYVKQKAFKLKEAVTIFADEQQTRPLYHMNADRVIDFRARYNFTDAAGNYLGSVKRQGARSLWRARYDIEFNDQVVATIQEENPWIKVADAVFSELPLIGMFAGYVFNPAYSVVTPDGRTVMRLVKEPAFLQGKFRIEETINIPDQENIRIILAMIMMLLLERRRG